MREHLSLLGFRVRDVVTGAIGVVTCISFDLYGCVQGLVQPEVEKDGKYPESRWFDTKRLLAIDSIPVMEAPSFDIIPGGQSKPGFRSDPIK